MSHGRSGPLALASGSALSSSSKSEGKKDERGKENRYANPNDNAHHQIPNNMTNDDAAVSSSGAESAQAAPSESEIQDDKHSQEIEYLQKGASVFVSDFDAQINSEAKDDAS